MSLEQSIIQEQDTLEESVYELGLIVRSPGLLIRRGGDRQTEYGVYLDLKGDVPFRVGVFDEDRIYRYYVGRNNDYYEGYLRHVSSPATNRLYTKQSTELQEELKERLDPSWPEVETYRDLYWLSPGNVSKQYQIYFRDKAKGFGYVAGSMGPSDLSSLEVLMKQMNKRVRKIVDVPEFVEGVEFMPL